MEKHFEKLAFKLEGTNNWTTWKFQLRVLLQALELYDVVEKDALTKMASEDFIKKDRKAQSLIVLNIHEKIMVHIINAKSASEMWAKLSTIYEKKSSTSLHIEQQKFFHLQCDCWIRKNKENQRSKKVQHTSNDISNAFVANISDSSQWIVDTGAKKETGNKIKIVRTDNGKEFINNNVKKLFEDRAIRHQTSVVYTAEQNGKIERDNRTVVECARTMLLSAKLNKNLWAEAVNTAVFILNRTGKTNIPEKSPFDIWFNKKYDISHLKLFGSKVHIHVPDVRRQKWDSKSLEGVFVGYGESGITETKGYRIYIPTNNTIEVKRDVIFIKSTDEKQTDTLLPESEVILDFESITDSKQGEKCQETTSSIIEQRTQEITESDVQETPQRSHTDVQTIEKQKRQIKKPLWWNDYETSFLCVIEEPKSYEEAVSSSYSEKWQDAMNKELQVLNENNTWTEVPVPIGKNVIDCKWVYRVKCDMDGNPTDFKARMRQSRRMIELSNRIRCLILLSMLFSILFTILSVQNYKYIEEIRLQLQIQEDENNAHNFTIKTEGCSIPAMNPFDVGIKEFVHFPKSLKECDKRNETLLKRNRTHIWINKDEIVLNDELKNNIDSLICCYKSFFMPESIVNIKLPFVDDRVKYESCINFSDAIEVKNEFVRVTCNVGEICVHDEFFIFALKKDYHEHNGVKEISRNKTAYNVLFIGLDAVSRLNFHRTMPKTLAYLQNKGAVSLDGFNKVGDNTFPNMIPMLLGISSKELQKTCLPHRKAAFDNCPFIWEWFKQAGYYTAFGEDGSRLRAFNYDGAGFIDAPTDYYLHTFMKEAEKNSGNNKDIFSYLCMHDKYFYKVLLDYVADLTFTLSDKKLFGFFWEFSMTHDYLNYPMIMDDDYASVFTVLERSKYLDDTVVFLVSDHGMRWGGIRLTKQGRLEERLPFAFILLPRSFRDNYSDAYDNLKLNGQRLTTPFDIHATMLDLIDMENIRDEKIFTRKQESYGDKRSISLFLPVPSNRTCESAEINEHWCTCNEERSISKDDPYVIVASTYLIEHFNEILSDYPQCARLRIGEIIEALEIVVKPSNNEIDLRVITVVLRSKPGDGIFEGTLRHVNGAWSISGTVSRLNLYGDQGRCMPDLRLRLYCYCDFL
ncbi:uncharacterized protein LOC113520884 [Galleria mellonella]|uniref:Uncharacterized protein LOC113520884 n=1 Tax=Galleria mellonella TaxID=7137 RepID=A0ABM3M9P3_GALME|nr:uncharacterized protein LOC113520884 [Galleria mellonella]